MEAEEVMDDMGEMKGSGMAETFAMELSIMVLVDMD